MVRRLALLVLARAGSAARHRSTPLGHPCESPISGSWWISRPSSSGSRYVASNAGAGKAGKVKEPVIPATGKAGAATKEKERTETVEKFHGKKGSGQKVEGIAGEGGIARVKAKRGRKVKADEEIESKVGEEPIDVAKENPKSKKTKKVETVKIVGEGVGDGSAAKINTKASRKKTIEAKTALTSEYRAATKTLQDQAARGVQVSKEVFEDQGAAQQTLEDHPETGSLRGLAEDQKSLVIVPESIRDEAAADETLKAAEVPQQYPAKPYEATAAAEVGSTQDDYEDVDDELKEFLTERRLQQEESDEDDGDGDDDGSDYIWDYRDLRQLPSSIKHLEKKLKELSATASPDDRRAAAVKLKLGEQICSISPQRAVDLANESLKVFGVGGDGSIEQAMCLAVLGAGYRGLEQYEKSLSYLQRASASFDEKNELGQDVVRETQFTMHQLGLTYFSLGRIKAGVESLLESLDLQETVLACDDPALGTDFRKAAEHLADVEQWIEAKKLCEKAIRIHGKINGFEDEEVGEDRKILARIYRGLNQHDLALEQLRIAKNIFAGDEQNLYWATMGIVDSQLCLESYSEAIATIEGSLDSIPKTPITYRGMAYLKLAKAFYLKKDFVEGQKRLIAALDFYKANLRDGSMSEVASQLHEIAALFDAMGDVKNSIRTLKIAIAAYDCVPGAEKLLINAKMDLGTQLIRHKKPESALGFYEQAMELSRKIQQPSSNLLALAGVAHLELSNFGSAMEVFEEAKALLESPEQGKRSELSKKLCFPKLSVYHNLVKCYKHFKRYDDALRCQKLLVAELRIVGREAEDKLPDAIRVLEELTERTNSSSSGSVAVQAQA